MKEDNVLIGGLAFLTKTFLTFDHLSVRISTISLHRDHFCFKIHKNIKVLMKVINNERIVKFVIRLQNDFYIHKRLQFLGMKGLTELSWNIMIHLVRKLQVLIPNSLNTKHKFKSKLTFIKHRNFQPLFYIIGQFFFVIFRQSVGDGDLKHN